MDKNTFFSFIYERNANIIIKSKDFCYTFEARRINITRDEELEWDNNIFSVSDWNNFRIEDVKIKGDRKDIIKLTNETTSITFILM